MDTTIHPPAATTYSVATNAPADQCLTEINNQRTTDDNVDNNVNNKAQRKVRSACDACQDAKIRCGREKPTCRRCQNQGRTCMYSHTRPLGRPRKINNSSTTANMNRNVDSLPDQRTQSDDAMMAPGSESGNPGSGTPLIPRSISRTNTETNNNNGTNPSMNDDWPDLPPLLSAEPRKPIHMSLDAMDDMEPSATSSGHNHMNVGLEPITQNTEMDMDMDMFMVADHHLFPALEEEDGQDDHHHHHQQRRGPRSLDSDPMTTGTTTEWDLGFQFDQALSSASSSSLNSGSTGAYAGDVLASSLTSKVGMELGGSHKISANSVTMGSQKKISRGSFRDDQFTHHDSLGSRSPKTTVSSSASSAVLNSISTTTSYSGRSRGEEVLLLSRQRMQCTCCDFVLQILADLDRHLSDRSVTSLDLIMKLERESRARTVTILQCDSCPQTFRPRIFLLMGLVLEAVVELLEKILHQNQLLGGLATTSSSSSSIPSGLAGTGLVSPPASGVYNNSNTTTPNRQGETISSCSLWLGDYEISGHEKHEFLKHLVAARLRDIAGTIRQLHQSMNQYRHRPAFEVGTSMLVEIYRHVHALVKLLNQ